MRPVKKERQRKRTVVLRFSVQYRTRSPGPNGTAYCVLRLFYGCSYRFHLSSQITVGTVILRALDRVHERALGCFYGCSTVVLMFHLSGNNRRDSHFMGS